MKTIATAALAFAVALFAAPAQAEDFYKGNMSTLVVGYASGGSYDISARLIARHLSRFIPGNPTVVVENMPGAGRCALSNTSKILRPGMAQPWKCSISPRSPIRC